MSAFDVMSHKVCEKPIRKSRSRGYISMLKVCFCAKQVDGLTASRQILMSKKDSIKPPTQNVCKAGFVRPGPLTGCGGKNCAGFGM
jgi:hypothetical protein